MGQPLTSYEVAAQAQTVLSESPVHALRKLRVDWDGHRLMLAGRVRSFYHKQLAQEVTRAVAHGRKVVNTINVEYQRPVA